MSQEVLLKKYGREFSKGTILFREGETQSKEMYVIHQGKVKIYKKVADQEVTLATLDQGEFFGEMAILNNKPRSAIAEVIEDSLLLVIDPKTFETMIKSNVEVAFRMIKKLAGRLEETDKQIEMFMMRDSSSRVIHTIQRLIESQGIKKDGGVSLPLTISVLADQAGVRIDRAQDIIDTLTKAKIISVSRVDIFIHDVERLNQYFDFLVLKEQFGDLESDR